MSDVRNRLERLGERISPAPNAFERLDRARRRRERNRRIATVVTALLVAGGGSIGVFAAIRGESAPTVAAGGDVADGIEIVCDGSGVSMSTFAVAASEAGVKMDVTNAGTTPLSFAIAPEGGGPDASVSAESLDPGTSSSFRPLPPGRYEASCGFPHLMGPPSATQSGPFEVVDPNGFYVDAVLDCPDSGYGMGMASAAGDGTAPQGELGDPVELVRAHLTGSEAGDVFERAGYVGEDDALVRVVRDETMVGLVHLAGVGNGGWILDSLEGCGATAFGWDGAGGTVIEPSPAITGASGSGATGITGVAIGSSGSIEPDPTCGQPLAELHLVSHDLAFDLGCLVAPADTRLSLLFTNTDVGIPKNVSIYAMTDCLESSLERDDVACALDDAVFSGDLIDGTEGQVETVYELPRLEPGRYWFQDDVHPSTPGGVLIVNGTAA